MAGITSEPRIRRQGRNMTELTLNPGHTDGALVTLRRACIIRSDTTNRYSTRKASSIRGRICWAKSMTASAPPNPMSVARIP